MMNFSELGIHLSFVPKLEKQGFTLPTPVQALAIPAILKQQDVFASAQTGSGKTISFVLPILMNLQNGQYKNRHVRVLVLVPTRELAIQVNSVFQDYNRLLPEVSPSLAVYGGVSINPQMEHLHKVQILVATPGRLLELVDKKAVHLSQVEVLILDEADKMLNLGFRLEMEQIFQLLPKVRQNLLFSATMNEALESSFKGLMHKPAKINIEPTNHTELIEQIGYLVLPEKKGPLLRYLIKEKPMEQVLVFTSSAYQADNVADKLRKNGITAATMHSKKSQGARLDALYQFKCGAVQALVATDILARGIDIQFLPFVVNYELPRSSKDFIHRIGRTGRAENPGKAISLIGPEELHHFEVIQKKNKMVIPTEDGDQFDLKGY